MKQPFQPLQKALLIRLAKLQQVNQEESGYALIAAVAMVVLLTGLVVTASIVGNLDTTSVRASEKSSKGFFAAEAGLNIRAQEIKDTFVNFVRPSGRSPRRWENCLDNRTANDGTEDFACSTDLTINDQPVITYVVDQTGDTPTAVPVSEGKFRGLNAQEYRYDVFSVALGNDGGAQLPSSILGMRFKSRLVPLFQFAIFYNDDVEFQVPPSMTINGRVHSNNNIFLNSGSGTLTLNSIITAGGTLYRGQKSTETDRQCNGTVRIETLGGSTPSLDCITGSPNTIVPYQNDTNPFTSSPSNITTWDQIVSTGIAPLTIPTPDEFTAGSGGEYWDNADLRVVLELDTSGNPTGIEIQDENGNATSKTNELLNSCSAQEERTLLSAADPDSNQLALNAAGFNDGDVLTIGTDLDSNVIASGGGSSSITLRRKTGHDSYQSGSIWDANTKVRKAVVSTSDTFYNYREKGKVPVNGDANVGTPIRMLNVDMRALIDCAASNNLMGKALNDESNGGLVWYFTVKGPNSNVDKSGVPFNASNSDPADVTGNNYGIRLYNGEHLYSTDSSNVIPKGLTVVSDQAVYVRGDYNLNRDESNTTTDFDGNSNINDNDKNTWIPAAILADTINVLSNSWEMDDSYSRTYNSTTHLPSGYVTFTNRTPSETTMNVAFLAGTDKAGGINGLNGGSSTDGDFESGGVNNYPRFHEHWGDTASGSQACDAIYSPNPTIWCFNYRGSFVSLSEPKRVNSRFCGSYRENDCNIYSPPVRNWDYDPRFDDAANLPPMTPRAVFLSQELFERDFSYTGSKPELNLFASLLPSNKPTFRNLTAQSMSPSFVF